jgi:hypothetical protein
MVLALRQIVTVHQAGQLEIRSPELRAGAIAEVIVLVEADKPVNPLETLDQLQKSVNLNSTDAAEWIKQVNNERAAAGRT